MRRAGMMNSLMALVASMMHGDAVQGETSPHKVASAFVGGGWGGPVPSGSPPAGAYFRRSPKKKAKWCRNCSFKGGKR